MQPVHYGNGRRYQRRMEDLVDAVGIEHTTCRLGEPCRAAMRRNEHSDFTRASKGQQTRFKADSRAVFRPRWIGVVSVVRDIGPRTSNEAFLRVALSQDLGRRRRIMCMEKHF